MLTGKGMKNGKAITTAASATPLDHWSNDIGQQACRR